jgi:serine/threonine protein kinase
LIPSAIGTHKASKTLNYLNTFLNLPLFSTVFVSNRSLGKSRLRYNYYQIVTFIYGLFFLKQKINQKYKMDPKPDVLIAVRRTFGPIEQIINTDFSHVFILKDGKVLKIPQISRVDDFPIQVFTADVKYIEKYSTQPGFMPLLDSGEFEVLPEQNVPYFLMPRLPEMGVHLQQLEGQGNLSLDYVIGVMQQAAQRLDTMHEQGDVYRDFKISQCYMTPEGLLVLSDFGISCEIGADAIAAGDHEMTRYGLAADTTQFRDAFAWGLEMNDLMKRIPKGDYVGTSSSDLIGILVNCTNRSNYNALISSLNVRPMQYVVNELDNIKGSL